MKAIILFLTFIFFTTGYIPSSTKSQFPPSQSFEQNKIGAKLVGDFSEYSHDDLAYINNLIAQSNFYGNWCSLGGHLVNEFQNTEGYLYMDDGSDGEFYFQFEIFDGPYMDQKVLTLLYDHMSNITFQDSTNAYICFHNLPLICSRTLKFGSSTVDYQVGATFGEIGALLCTHYLSVLSYHECFSACTVSTTVYLINTVTGQPFVITGNTTSDLENLGIQFLIQGDVCGINLITSIMTIKNSLFDAQGIPYFITILLFGVVQCIICFILEKIVRNKEGYGRRISPWSLLILNAFDLYFLLATAYFFMSYSPIYELASIPFAFLAFLYEPRLVWRIFQIHGRRLDDRINSTKRRSRLEIQSYFGMLLLFLCLLVSLVVYPNFVYFLAALFLLPQIKHNYSNSQSYKWNFWIVFGLGLPKLLITVYSKLDPSNLLRTTPNSLITFAFGGLVAIQLILLTIQRKRPRFGIDDHSHYKVYFAKRSVKSSQELCSICLEKLKSSNASDTQSFLNDPKKAKMMILTPCRHEFHLVCLTQWLKSKLECPYCRSELPILPEDEDDDDF